MLELSCVENSASPSPARHLCSCHPASEMGRGEREKDVCMVLSVHLPLGISGVNCLLHNLKARGQWWPSGLHLQRCFLFSRLLPQSSPGELLRPNARFGAGGGWWGASPAGMGSEERWETPFPAQGAGGPVICCMHKGLLQMFS